MQKTNCMLSDEEFTIFISEYCENDKKQEEDGQD